jgi:hypothetical protein
MGHVFAGDEKLTTALLDRLAHHATVITTKGNGYRMRQHTELWQALHAPPEPESASRRRRASRQEVPTA